MEGMEGMEQRKALGQLIRSVMPRTLEVVAEKRRLWGDAHVVLCQQKALAGEPGWFWAWEGGVAVGTPSREMLDDPSVAAVLNQFPGAMVVWMRPPADPAVATGKAA